jgi:hypothetical protein
VITVGVGVSVGCKRNYFLEIEKVIVGVVIIGEIKSENF